MSLKTYPLPPEHPKDIVWLALLGGTRFERGFRGPGGCHYVFSAKERILKYTEQGWDAAVPVLRDHAEDLIQEVAYVEPQPDAHGDVPAVGLREIPRFQQFPPPPTWRMKIQAAHAANPPRLPREVATGKPKAGASKAEIQAVIEQTQAAAQQEQYGRLADAVRSGRLGRDAVESMIDAGIAPDGLRDLLPAEVDAEAAAYVGGTVQDVKRHISEIRDPALLGRMLRAERARQKGPRAGVVSAIEQAIAGDDDEPAALEP